MLKTVEAIIEEYESKLRHNPINVVNIDELSPEFVIEALRPLVPIPLYGANRRPIMESEITPLMCHYANLYSQLGELLGIMAHRVRHYEIMGQRENGKTARTKREILDEARRDVKVYWETCRSLAFGQQSFLKPPE